MSKSLHNSLVQEKPSCKKRDRLHNLLVGNNLTQSRTREELRRHFLPWIMWRLSFQPTLVIGCLAKGQAWWLSQTNHSLLTPLKLSGASSNKDFSMLDLKLVMYLLKAPWVREITLNQPYSCPWLTNWQLNCHLRPNLSVGWIRIQQLSPRSPSESGKAWMMNLSQRHTRAL